MSIHQKGFWLLLREKEHHSKQLKQLEDDMENEMKRVEDRVQKEVYVVNFFL